MLILINSTKSFDFKTPAKTNKFSEPYFIKEAAILVEKLKTYSISELAETMNISSNIAKQNADRFKHWNSISTAESSKQSIFAFSGEVFRGLNAINLNDSDLDFAQNHLRILSGLYGVLCPLDMIYPYRLEMETKFKIQGLTNLYKFWDSKLTQKLNQDLHEADYILNLTSSEYFKSIKKHELNGKIITPIFKELKNGIYKGIITYTKNARGSMVNFIIKNKITKPDLLKGFDTNGYVFSAEQSDEKNYVFLRG